MSEYRYNIRELFQDELDLSGEEDNNIPTNQAPSGLMGVVPPVTDTPQEEDTGGLTKSILNFIIGTPYFDTKQQGIEALEAKKADEKKAMEMAYADFMQAQAIQSADEVRRMRAASTIGLVGTGDDIVKRQGMKIIEIPPPAGGDISEEKLDDVPIVTPDVVTDDADGGAAPSDGKGLMSPTTEEADEDTTESSNIFATIVKAGVSESVDVTTSLSSGFNKLAESEGTDIHLDGRNFVTLPYGIVPDKDSVKKSDGTTFDPTGKHGLTASDLADVDYSRATKFGISRTDYDNDQDFAKAVYAEFSKRTSSAYGTGFDDLTDAAKEAAYDMAWNAGINSVGWSSVKTMLQETSKEGTKSKDSLIEFTTNFRSGTDYPRGLLKRRLQTYNLVANEGEKAALITTTAVKTDGKRTGTLYTIKDEKGTTLKTWTKPDTDEKLGDLKVL